MSEQPLLAWLVASAPVGVALLDRELRIVQLNDALAAITGHAVVDHVGRTWNEVSPAFDPEVEPSLRSVLATGVPILDRECESAGERRLVVSYFAVRSDRREIVGVGAMVVDVTDRGISRRDLEDGVELRDHVIAVVSHDLRNPLQVIDVTTTSMMREPDLDPARAHRLRVIRRSVSRMRRLVEDLVTAAKLRAGLFALELQPVFAAELVAEAIDLLQPAADPYGIRLEYVAGDAATVVTCDRERVLQVLGNLIDNAVRHSRPGDAIDLSTETHGDAVVFSVRDRGSGMTPELARGTLVGPTRSLGFYICKGIVERHGGAISLASELGRGTTVTFTLPQTRPK